MNGFDKLKKWLVCGTMAVIVTATGYSPMNPGMAERAAKIQAMSIGAAEMQKNTVKVSRIITKSTVKENGRYICTIEMEVE